MSHSLTFDILPFDWKSPPQAEIQLSIDVTDFAQGLQAVYPAGEVNIVKVENSTVVRLYISTELIGPWVVANFVQSETTFIQIEAWPKTLAVKLILWYRQYINQKHPLFLIVSDTGEGIELTKDTTQQDVENAYPSNWIIKEWEG